MPRKGTVGRREVLADPLCNSVLVQKFVNAMMWDGKKSVTERVFYDAMDIIAKRIKDTPSLEVFEKAVDNVKPMIEVRSKRVGGANYQVPMQVNPKRQRALAFRWIIQAARATKGRPTADALANELCAAYNKEGAAMTSRENMHRMAEANRALAHFAWR